MADPYMNPVTTNVLVGMATMYLAPIGEPAPADTVAIGTAWGGQWVTPGATDSGLTLTYTRNTNDIRIEEQSTPVARLTDTTDLAVAVTFAEDTLANMKYAYGGGTIVTQAAATGVIGKSTLTLSDTLTTLALGFEGKNQFGFFRRVIIPIVVSSGSVGTSYRRAADKRMYPATFSALCPLSAVTIVEKTANALP